VVFLVKAAILSGRFYLQAGALFATGLVMAWLSPFAERAGVPDVGLTLFGVVSAICFIVPGWRHWRQRQ
jgi:serine/threonine-protein kinase